MAKGSHTKEQQQQDDCLARQYPRLPEEPFLAAQSPPQPTAIGRALAPGRR